METEKTSHHSLGDICSQFKECSLDQTESCAVQTSPVQFIQSLVSFPDPP